MPLNIRRLIQELHNAPVVAISPSMADKYLIGSKGWHGPTSITIFFAWLSEARCCASRLEAREPVEIAGEELGEEFQRDVTIAFGKLTSPMSPQRWFERLLQAQGVRLADISPDVLIASSFLPGAPVVSLSWTEPSSQSARLTMPRDNSS